MQVNAFVILDVPVALTVHCGAARHWACSITVWDTGGMERVASITSSYYKHSEAAILVFALDNPDTFHILSQHLLDIVTYAENAKIFLYVCLAFVFFL